MAVAHASLLTNLPLGQGVTRILQDVLDELDLLFQAEIFPIWNRGIRSFRPRGGAALRVVACKVVFRVVPEGIYGATGLSSSSGEAILHELLQLSPRTSRVHGELLAVRSVGELFAVAHPYQRVALCSGEPLPAW